MGASSASPPPPMERLRGIFLRRLEVDFLKLRPRFVAAVRDADERATTPEERARLSDEAVEQFGGDPIQPWNRLLTALEDIEMKLDAVRFSVEMTRRSEDGRLMTFVEYHRPVLLKAAAEALEHFVNQLRANRIVRAEFVEMQIRRVRDSLLRDDVLNARPQRGSAYRIRRSGQSILGSIERAGDWETAAALGVPDALPGVDLSLPAVSRGYRGEPRTGRARVPRDPDVHERRSSGLPCRD